MNGSTEESYLGLASSELDAIVQITDGSPAGELCTGVFVSNAWLVTAEHCLAIESPRVILATPDGSVELEVVERVAHAVDDVALLRVADSDPAAAAFEPIPVASAGNVAIGLGSVVEVAGYGVTESGDTRELRFLTEAVTEVNDDTFVVDGFGANGACWGDSGGPLLVRDSSGPVRVLGVLSTGSGSCLDRDRYARLDVLDDWIASVVGSDVPSEDGCGGITEEGRCLYGSAMFCAGGTLVADPCSPTTACGWDALQLGFRCVKPASDPCSGTDSVGAYRDGAALWCNHGALESEHCRCGEVCRVDGTTGAPRCAEPEQGSAE